MPDLTFEKDGIIRLHSKYNGGVTFSKWKWDDICSRPERYYYRHNGEKIPTTLINPDFVRHHKTEPNQLIYYKSFETYQITDGVESSLPHVKYLAVIIDKATKKVCTTYPTPKMKPGKEYKGEEEIG